MSKVRFIPLSRYTREEVFSTDISFTKKDILNTLQDIYFCEKMEDIEIEKNYDDENVIIVSFDAVFRDYAWSQVWKVEKVA